MSIKKRIPISYTVNSVESEMSRKDMERQRTETLKILKTIAEKYKMQ